MTMPDVPAVRLRALLDAPGPLVLPGRFDALSARLLERAGHPAAYVSGFGTAATAYGLPDVGLVSFGEMLDRAAAMAAAVAIPLVADADTGYGNAANVRRTVGAFAQAGLAGVQIEDQVWPKRCGHAGGVEVVGLDEARRRVRAAVDARDDGDVVIVARTDARTALDFEAALERGRAFADDGADVVFLEALASAEEIGAACEAIPAPLLVNLIEGGATPLLSPAELTALGARIVIYPLTLLRVVTGALARHLREPGAFEPYDGAPSFEELKTLVGFDEHEQRLERH